MSDDLVKRLRPDPQYKTALEIALEDALEAIPSLATLQLMLGQGDYPAFPDVVRSALRDMASAADRIKALEAALERVTLNRDGLTADNDELTAALAEKEAEVTRLQGVLEGVRSAIDTGRNEPLAIWRDQIDIALNEKTPTDEGRGS